MEPTTSNKPTKPAPSEPLVSEDELIIPGEEPVTTNPNLLAIIIGVLVVVLVAIFGGLYLWGSLISQEVAEPAPTAVRPTAEENNEPESTTAEAEVETAAALSPSDSLSAIAADLENTDLDGLTTELNAIEAEFESAAVTE
jgi:hypothetical protein